MFFVWCLVADRSSLRSSPDYPWSFELVLSARFVWKSAWNSHEVLTDRMILIIIELFIHRPSLADGCSLLIQVRLPSISCQGHLIRSGPIGQLRIHIRRKRSGSARFRRGPYPDPDRRQAAAPLPYSNALHVPPTCNTNLLTGSQKASRHAPGSRRQVAQAHKACPPPAGYSAMRCRRLRYLLEHHRSWT